MIEGERRKKKRYKPVYRKGRKVKLTTAQCQ